MDRDRDRNHDGASVMAGGAAAPAGPVTPTVQVLAAPVACSSSTVHETMFSWALAAATEYIIEINGAITAADNAADWIGSLVIPTGATGRWSAAGGVSYNSGGGDLTESATIARTQTTNTPLIVRIRILTDEAGTLTLRFLTGTNGQAVTVIAGSAALLRTSPNVVKLADNVTNSSSTVPVNVLQVSCGASAKTWVDIEIHYSTTGTTVRPVWQLSADGGATFFVAMANTQIDASDTAFNQTRRDNTATNMATTKSGMNIVRMRALVTTTDAATLTLTVMSSTNGQLITCLAGSWTRYADVTSAVQVLGSDVRHESATPEDTFTHAVVADSVYWIAGCAGWLLETATITIKVDSNGIPAAATMLMLDHISADETALAGYVATDGTDKHGVGNGSTTVELQWQYDGVLITGENAGTFARRHGTELATWHVDVKAGSFSIAELVELAA